MIKLKKKLYEIIFGSSTPAGKAFDIALIAAILMSVLVVMLDTVKEIHDQYADALYLSEWAFTLLFTVEYSLRIYCSPKPRSYIFSFYGAVDLLSILPTYVSLLIPGTQFLLVIRTLRVLRIFRVLKIIQYVGESDLLWSAVWESRRRIAIFLMAILTLTLILGSMMYLIEGSTNGVGFSSIPTSVYWAIVTLTTVGYGDISPITPIGQALAAFIMILGYSVIAVPSGLISVEWMNIKNRSSKSKVCRNCKFERNDSDALYCKICGGKLVGKSLNK